MTPKQRSRLRESVWLIKKQIEDYRAGRWDEAFVDSPCPRRRKPTPPQHHCPGSSQSRRWKRLLKQYQAYLVHAHAAYRAEREGDRGTAIVEDLRAEVAIYSTFDTLRALHVHIDFHYRLRMPHLPDLVRELLVDQGFLPKCPE
jgi:hypothetical protein